MSEICQQNDRGVATNKHTYIALQLHHQSMHQLQRGRNKQPRIHVLETRRMEAEISSRPAADTPRATNAPRNPTTTA